MHGRKKATSGTAAVPPADMSADMEMEPVTENAPLPQKRPRGDIQQQLSDKIDLLTENMQRLMHSQATRDDVVALRTQLERMSVQTERKVHALTETSQAQQQQLTQLKLHDALADERFRLLDFERRQYNLHLHNIPIDTSAPGQPDARQMLLTLLAQMKVPDTHLVTNVYFPQSASSSSTSVSSRTNVNINFQIFPFDINSQALLRILTTGAIKRQLKEMKITIYPQMSPEERKNKSALLQHPTFTAAVKAELSKLNRQGSVIWQLDYAVLGRGSNRKLWHIKSIPSTGVPTASSATASHGALAPSSAAAAAATAQVAAAPSATAPRVVVVGGASGATPHADTGSRQPAPAVVASPAAPATHSAQVPLLPNGRMVTRSVAAAATGGGDVVMQDVAGPGAAAGTTVSVAAA